MDKRGSIAVSLALAATIFGASALAQAPALTPWDGDAGKRFTFSAPTGWPVDRLSQPTAGVTEYEAGAADAACKFYVIDRPEQANQPIDRWVAANSKPIETSKWTEILMPFPAFRRGLTIESSSMDSSNYWPQQRAIVATPDAKITAAVTTRPGLEIYTFCQSFDGKDRSAVFDAVIKSIATPQDGDMQSKAEAAKTARQAAEDAAKAAAAQAPSGKEKKKKN